MREGGTRKDITTTTQQCDLNKSCDRCGLKKRRCDGEKPCRRCARLGETCTYTRRKPRARKRQPPGSIPGGSSRGPSIDAPVTLLQQSGRVSLKRCRLSPSPATGLVGMEENTFLSDYFACVGFLPFTSQRNIRETMVKMFAGSVSGQHSHSGDDYSTTEQHFDATMLAHSHFPVDPSTCVFWCAVTLGSLVKGRPIESVEKYCRLARDALANVSGPPNGEVARAWAIMGYMSDFCGHHDNFHVYIQRANAILCDVQEEGSEKLPEGVSDVVRHAETIKLFVGDLDRNEVESFCNKEQASPQMTKVVTEAGISQFVMRSYRSFEQALYENVAEHQPTAHSLEGDGEPSADIALTAPVGAELLNGSRPHFFASAMREAAGSRSSRIMNILKIMTRRHSRQFQLIEQAADWSSIRGGVGGFIINGTLVFEKIAAEDISGALENLENCSEVLQRYPGVCRFTMWLHVTHMLMMYLTVIGGPRARGIYDQMRAPYNSALRPGAQAIPPFEEWQGLSSYCDVYPCRLMEFMVTTENYGTSSCSPQERAAEMQEKGPRDVLVDSGQQRGAPSPTRSHEGTGGSYPVVARPTHKVIDGLRSKREPERASDGESVGCMENVSSDGRRNALTQPQEPMLTLSCLFREVVSGEVVDSDACRTVNDQSSCSDYTEFGGQATEALLSSVFTKGREMMIDGTEDEDIGVEDWLDVTHAMLDTGGLGLDFE